MDQFKVHLAIRKGNYYRLLNKVDLHVTKLATTPCI